MLPDRGANDRLPEEHLPRQLFRPGAHLHVAGYALLGAGSRAAARAALALAAMADMTVSVTPSSAAPLASVGAEQFLGWTAGVDLLLTNAAEAEVLTGTADPRRSAALLAGHYREVVVTAGARGAVWADGLVVATAAAGRVDVVDTAGAGDAFTAGFLAEWLVNPEPETALAAGNRLAAEAVQTAGARPPADDGAAARTEGRSGVAPPG
jgi:sugar/nucleoside kinase (ribokinase family)